MPASRMAGCTWPCNGLTAWIWGPLSTVSNGWPRSGWCSSGCSWHRRSRRSTTSAWCTGTSKPSNVLVRDIGGRDHAYLTDFGIAKAPAAQDSLTRTGALMGTPAYLSPEQIRGQQPGPRSDLYALGCVIFEALTGQRPFGGDDDLAARWAQATGPPPAASALCPALGSRYDAFLAQALAADPQDRFPSGAAFAEALQAAHTGQPRGLTQTPATRGVPARRASGSSPQPPAVSGTRPATVASSSDARGPAVLPPARSRSARPAATAADITPATAPTARAGRSTRPPRAGSRARPSRARAPVS